MSFTKMWIHLVWSTKNQRPYLTKEIRQEIFDHIREHARIKGIDLDQINGFTDHVHCLIALQPDQSVSKIVQSIKGESAYWINNNILANDYFRWENHYFAASVGTADLSFIREYIRDQEVHHSTLSFKKEAADLISGLDVRVS